MPAVSRAHPEHVGVEVARDLVADHRASERYVSRGNTLCEGHDVRDHAFVIRADPFPGAPDGYLRGLREICDKYGILLMFDEDRGDVLGTFVPDHLFDVGQRLL